MTSISASVSWARIERTQSWMYDASFLAGTMTETRAATRGQYCGLDAQPDLLRPLTVPPPSGRFALAQHRVLAPVLTTYGAIVGAAALSLVNVMITSRALGPSGRGELAFLTTVAMLSATLATLGIEEANGNLVGSEPASRPALATNSLILALLLGGTAAAFVIALTAAFPGVGGGSTRALLWLAVAAVPVLVLQTSLLFLIRADYAFAVANVAALVGPVLTVTVNATLAAAGRLSAASAFTVWGVAQLLSTALLAWYVARRLAGFGRPDRRLALRALGFGVKAHTGRVMKTGNYRLDQWLLGSMAGPRELGLYSVAVAWSEALFYLPEALGMVMRPDFVRASRTEALRRGALAFRVAVIVTVPLVLLLLVAAPFLCVTVFGEEFRDSIANLRVLAPGAFGILALKLLANALTAQRKPMLANCALAVAFATTIALDIVLIPGHGGLGAAIASTVAYTAGGIAVAVIFVRTLDGRLSDLLPRARDVTRLVASTRPQETR
jgi:O-antigen/teichoic acid export membrane protein